VRTEQPKRGVILQRFAYDCRPALALFCPLKIRLKVEAAAVIIQGDSGMEIRLGSLEKGLAEMKEKLITVSSKADSMEKHFATKADLTTTEANLIKWYLATAFAMTGLGGAITFGLTRLFAT
jgi:hypothetical protein